MSTLDGVLHAAPETLDAVRMVDAVYPLLQVMLDVAMLITNFRQSPICAPIIGANCRALGDMFLNQRKEMFAGCSGSHRWRPRQQQSCELAGVVRQLSCLQDCYQRRLSTARLS